MFDNKFTKMGNDSLAEAAKQAMQDGDLRRKAETYVNESFGVYSRKAVVREQLAAYDAAIEEVYTELKEGMVMYGADDRDDNYRRAQRVGKVLSKAGHKVSTGGSQHRASVFVTAKKGTEKALDARLQKHADKDYGTSYTKEKMDEKKDCMYEGKPLADKDYDKDGKIESPKDEVWGSRLRAAKMAGKLKEEETDYSAPDRAAVTKDSKPVVSDTASKADTSGPSASDKAGLASKIKAIKEAAGPKQTPRYPQTEKIAANKVKGQPLPSETRHANPGALTRVAGQQALAEKAPPGAKMERMVKHIKKGYAADGELTKKEKGIAYATAWKSYGKHKKGLKEETISLEEANEAFASFVAEAINTFALAEHPVATVENLHMFNEEYVVACLAEAYSCSEKKMKKYEKMKKDLEEAAEAFGKEKEIKEAKYSFKAAREGKDIGKPGKNFEKIAKKAGEKYGSEEKGKKVAGAVLAKIRAKHMKEEQIDEIVLPSQIRAGETLGQAMNRMNHKTAIKGGANDPSSPKFRGASPAASTPGTQGVATGKSFSAIDRAQSAKAKAGPADNPGLRGAPQASSMSSPGTVARDTGITGKPGGETGVTSGSTVSLDRQGNVGASPTAAPSPAPKPTTAPAPSSATPPGAKPSTSGLVGPEAGKMATPAAAAPAAPVTSQPGAPKDDASAGVKKVMSMSESVQVGSNKYKIV